MSNIFFFSLLEALDVSTWDQANHNILIVLTVLVSILLLINIVVIYYIICLGMDIFSQHQQLVCAPTA